MLNKAILVGRLAADPEMRQTPQGVLVATFRVAVNRSYQKDGERKADFLTVVCWRSQAEFVCKYFRKGSDIGIDGRIQVREYQDRDGNKRSAYEIVAEQISFVGRKGQADTDVQKDFTVIDDADDLPF